MSLSVNAKKNFEFDSLKQYIRTINDRYVEKKSKLYSFDFKSDTPTTILSSDEDSRGFSIKSAKVDRTVNYEWQEINGNLIGRKMRKSSDCPLKKRLKNMFENKNVSGVIEKQVTEDSDLSSGSPKDIKSKPFENIRK